MKRFIEGEDRRQATLLPDSLEDYVTEDNPVRVVDVFIDELDLEAWGFSGVVPAVTRRPAYHPATLLKIYLYGYLNRIPIEPAARTGDPTQHRADLADRPTDAGLQDDRRLPPRQRAGDPRGLRAVRRAVPSVQPFHADYRCDRREQVQGGQSGAAKDNEAKYVRSIDGLSLLQLFPAFRHAIQKGAGFAVEKLNVLRKKSTG